MTTDSDSGVESPRLYDLVVSGRVYEQLLELVDAAKVRRDGEACLAALAEFRRRLRLYPQFGDPLADLVVADGQVRLGAVAPLSMRYGVLESRREVLVTALPVLLSRRAGDA